MKMETRKVKVMTIKGKPVMDGVAPKKLVILPDDIAHAKTESASACAAAVAIRRQYKVKGARVYLSVSYMEHDTIWVRYETPRSLRDEIIRFDSGYRNWQGGEFTLKPPKPSHQMGARSHRRKMAEANGAPPDTRRNHHGKVKHYKINGVRRAMRADGFE